MPHKYYHGKTGQIWNVTKRAVGVEITKKVCRGGLLPRGAQQLKQRQPAMQQAAAGARQLQVEQERQAAQLATAVATVENSSDAEGQASSMVMRGSALAGRMPGQPRPARPLASGLAGTAKGTAGLGPRIIAESPRQLGGFQAAKLGGWAVLAAGSAQRQPYPPF